LSSSEQYSDLSYVSIAAERLTIDVCSERETRHVWTAGELDMASVPWLEAELRRLLDGSGATVILDLSGLDFIDASGLHCLIRAARRSREAGRSLRFVRGSGEVDRVVRLSGVGGSLPFID
jgi:anti-sigma B factor antagonist